MLRVLEQREARGHDLGQVVRRDVGRHPDRDARRAVDQQIRQPRRQNRRLELLAVVIRGEIDGFLVDVGQHFRGDLLQPALGVAIRRRRVAVDRAEVALTVDQRIAQREVLHHAHQRLVGRGIAVRVILAEDVADHARAFDVRAVPDVVGFVHRKQHAAMHRFEAVPDIGQGPPDDHAHGVIEVGMPHFGFQADRKGFFGELLHRGKRSLAVKTVKSGRPGRASRVERHPGTARPAGQADAEKTNFNMTVVLTRQCKLLNPNLCSAKIPML